MQMTSMKKVGRDGLDDVNSDRGLLQMWERVDTRPLVGVWQHSCKGSSDCVRKAQTEQARDMERRSIQALSRNRSHGG